VLSAARRWRSTRRVESIAALSVTAKRDHR
jgi:hypothetical protein